MKELYLFYFIFHQFTNETQDQSLRTINETKITTEKTFLSSLLQDSQQSAEDV